MFLKGDPGLDELSKAEINIYGKLNESAIYGTWLTSIVKVSTLKADIAESAVITELLRRHDPDFGKTVKLIVAGDTNRIQSMMEVFNDQRFPVCAVRDGDVIREQRNDLFVRGIPQRFLLIL